MNNSFIEKVNELYPNEFLVLGEYSNQNSKVLVKHLICEEEYYIYPYDFLKQRYTKCKTCSKKQALIERIEKALKDNFNNEYTFDILDAQKVSDKILIRHKECGEEFKTSLNSFNKSSGCYYCSGILTSKNSIQRRIDKMTEQGEFILLGEDFNSVKKVRLDIFHTKCNTSFNANLSHFIYDGAKCKNCTKEKNAIARRKSHYLFLEEFINIYGNTYSVISEYITSHTPIKLIHNECGEEIEVKPCVALTLTFACTVCKMSNPENIIYNEIKNNVNLSKISAIPQYKFKDCLGERNRKLPFDFAVLKDNKLLFLIEYDGQHHSDKTIYGEKSFNCIIKNDAIKNKYCEDNDIKLYRISYKDFKFLRGKVKEILIENDIFILQ